MTNSPNAQWAGIIVTAVLGLINAAILAWTANLNYKLSPFSDVLKPSLICVTELVRSEIDSNNHYVGVLSISLKNENCNAAEDVHVDVRTFGDACEIELKGFDHEVTSESRNDVLIKIAMIPPRTTVTMRFTCRNATPHPLVVKDRKGHPEPYVKSVYSEHGFARMRWLSA